MLLVLHDKRKLTFIIDIKWEKNEEIVIVDCDECIFFFFYSIKIKEHVFVVKMGGGNN